jgi:two-component system sensor histidine kinase VicK
MFRIVFLRRIALILLISLCLAAAISTVLFVFASNRTLEEKQLMAMQKQAEAIAQYYGRESTQTLDPDTILSIMSDPEIVGSYILIYDTSHVLRAESLEISEDDTTVKTRMKNYLDRNLLTTSNPVSMRDVIDNGNETDRIMVVQEPIFTMGTLSGFIVIARSSESVFPISRSLLEVLILSSTIASFLILIPFYFSTYRLVRPLQNVNIVARAMGEGDFSVRANTKSKSEVGELAKSFNDLAEKLSNSITELTIERNRLREIFDVISEGIVSVDLDMNPLYSNPAIITLFENARHKNLFTELMQLIPFEEVWDDVKKCIATGVAVERTIESRDNVYLSTIVPTFDNNDQVAGATGFFRDITESERLEQTRRDYVANVSHELRTPLTALRGLVEPLADGMVRNETDRMRYYGIILHETMRLSRLIDDMLELSRLQARTLAFKTFPFDLNVILTDIEAKFTPVMTDASLLFKVVYKSGPCPTVSGNPDRVEQILVILMDNAKKYTPPGGSITITTETNDKQDQVLVSVIDTGQGIHEYDIDHIFDRFYKADRARGKKGTGLGLSIARELLNYMGETISVKSEYGEGTTFTFTLKRVRGSQWHA